MCSNSRIIMLHYIKMLIQLLLAPKNGWEDIAEDTYDGQTLMYRGFLPLLFVASLSSFAQLFYLSSCSVLDAILQSVIMFGVFYGVLYLGEFFFSLYIIKLTDTSINYKRINMFLIYSLSVMALMTMLMKSVPFSPVLILLPLYSLVVMRRGARFMGVSPANAGKFMFLCIGAVFFPVYFVIYLLGLLLSI